MIFLLKDLKEKILLYPQNFFLQKYMKFNKIGSNIFLLFQMKSRVILLRHIDLWTRRITIFIKSAEIDEKSNKTDNSDV